MIVDGRALAGEVLARTKARADKLKRRPLIVALTASDTPATRSYLGVKARCATDAGCVFETRALGSSFADADAVIVQLPVPIGINQKEVCDAIPVSKDADVLSSAARAQFEMMDLRNPSLLPPVVGAVKKILEFGNVEIKNKKVVVIGGGWLVGNPCAVWLKQQGAEVSVLTSKLENLAMALGNADIIVSGAGSPHLIKPEMLKQGVVLIDAGTSESGSTIVGDADPACAEVCSLFTPVPGGVGPLAVAMLFENAVTLAERANSSILAQ